MPMSQITYSKTESWFVCERLKRFSPSGSSGRSLSWFPSLKRLGIFLVSPESLFSSFSTRKTLFSAAKHVSASRQKHVLLKETMFPVWQNWETSRKMFPATCLLVLPGICVVLPESKGQILHC